MVLRWKAENSARWASASRAATRRWFPQRGRGADSRVRGGPGEGPTQGAQAQGKEKVKKRGTGGRQECGARVSRCPDPQMEEPGLRARRVSPGSRV